LTGGLSSWSPAHQALWHAGRSGQLEAAEHIYDNQTLPIATDMQKAAEDLRRIQRRMLADSAERGRSKVASSRWISILLVVLSAAIGAVVVKVILRMNNQLRNHALQLAEGAEQITSAASQVASSSQSLAQGASEQAASLEETSASSEEITSMTRKNSENSQSAADVMATVDQHVKEGNRTLEQMVVSMSEINASSDKISKIIKVIDEIAFQTNILALNAAVEAARAGEAGMGFAVVADEVRNLAQRASQAAKDTAMLIEQSIANTSQGRQDVQQVVKSVTTITTGVDKVKSLVEEVSSSTRQQAHGIDSVAEAVARISKVTQMTAATAEESAAASEELNAQAESAMDEVRRLDALVSGGHDTSTAPTADMFAPTPTAAEIIPMPMPGALSAQGAAQGASRQRRTVAAISAR